MKNVKLTREQKDAQIRKEAKATFILFAICFVWNVVTAYGLSGTGIRIGGLPLWWLLSTPGMFVIAVVGVVYLLKKVFVNFDLNDEPEGGAGDAE
ncbi:MAG: YhdT family protein [Mogibacterium sp.]|nr:YhdT family protein [Mogibacterium sp.]